VTSRNCSSPAAETCFFAYPWAFMTRVLPSNENKMSDGWRESAWLRVEGGVSWKIWSQSCQPFAPPHG
jgi:hypothetical protein